MRIATSLPKLNNLSPRGRNNKFWTLRILDKSSQEKKKWKTNGTDTYHVSGAENDIH